MEANVERKASAIANAQVIQVSPTQSATASKQQLAIHSAIYRPDMQFSKTATACACVSAWSLSCVSTSISLFLRCNQTELRRKGKQAKKNFCNSSRDWVSD